MTNNDKWRLFRKLVHQCFNEKRCEEVHVTLQNAEAVQMLRDTCMAPEMMMSHPKRFSNSVIMSLGMSTLPRSMKRPMFGRETGLKGLTLCFVKSLASVAPRSGPRIL